MGSTWGPKGAPGRPRGGQKRLKIHQKLRSWAQAGPQGRQKHPLAPKSHQNWRKIVAKLLRALVEKFAIVTPLRKLFRRASTESCGKNILIAAFPYLHLIDVILTSLWSLFDFAHGTWCFLYNSLERGGLSEAQVDNQKAVFSERGSPVIV